LAYSKEERERNKLVLLATLNYLIENHIDGIAFDDYNPMKEFYLSEIERTQIDIQKSRSGRIKNRLDRLLENLEFKNVPRFKKYIHTHTGYEIELTDRVKAGVLQMLAPDYKGVILVNNIENYLAIYGDAPEEQENVAILKEMQAKWQAMRDKLIPYEDVITVSKHIVVTGTKQREYSDEEYQKYSSKWRMYEKTSPDGLSSLRLEISGSGECALTYVVISLRGGSGVIYSARGERLPINAYWENEHHIVIEMPNEYETFFKYNKVSSYGNTISIEYRLSNN